METLEVEARETLDPKTLGDPEPQTLAMPHELGLGLGLDPPFSVGDFVWGNIKGQQWWPGRVRDPSEASAQAEASDQRSLLVAYFGVDSVAWCKSSNLKSFVESFDKMASSSSSKSFRAALDSAVSELSNSGKFGNCSAKEFLDLVKDVSLDASVVNALEIAMLKSRVVTFEKDLDVGHERKSIKDLVDKIDLDVPAAEVVERIPSEKSSRGKKKKKSMTSLIAQMDVDLDPLEKKESDSVGGDLKEEEIGSSGRRERKKSKYLSPPYTYLSGEITKSLKSTRYSSTVVKCSTQGLDKEDEDEESFILFQADGFNTGEVLSELVAAATDSLYLKSSPLCKLVRGFVLEFRSSMNTRSLKNIERDNNENANKEVGDKSEEGKKTEGKRERERKDVVTGEGESLIDKSEEGDKSEAKRVRKTKDMVDGKGETPIDKSGEGKKTEGEDAMAIVKYDEGKKAEVKKGRKRKDVVNGLGETPTDQSEEGKKSEVKRGRKKKDAVNGEGVTPVRFNHVLKEGANGNTPATLKVETVSISGDAGGKRGRKKTEPSLNSVFDFSLGFENENNAELVKTTQEQSKEEEAANKKDPTIIDVPISVGSKIAIGSREKKPRQRKNKKNTTTHEDPTALLLTFSPGVNLPSKEDLISACSKYGPIINSESELLKESSSAKVVFEKSSDAEKAFNDKVAALGQSVASYRLRYLTGNLSSSSSQVPKPPLPYIRKSLERMISSLGGSPVEKVAGEDLVGEMQGLLMKVDRMLTGPAAGNSS